MAGIPKNVPGVPGFKPPHTPAGYPPGKPGLHDAGGGEFFDSAISTGAANDAPHAAGASNERYQSWLAAKVRDSAASGGEIPEEYLQFLLDAGIDPRTVEDVRGGVLPMDDRSRTNRAISMGLNPGRRWYRVDNPGKTEFRGRAREGVVYAGFHPELAKEASQAGFAQKYTLIGPNAIYGLPADDRSSRRLIDAAMKDKQRLVSAGKARFLSGLIDSATSPREPVFRPGTSLTDSGSTWIARGAGDAPFYGDMETKMVVDDLLSRGYGGSLVRDEGGVSVGIVSPTIRHASLSVLDPRRIGARNIFYSAALAPLLAPPANQETR